VTDEQLVAAVRELTDYGGVYLTDIEKQLGIPKNMLSGMLNKRRPFVPKWKKKILEYLLTRPQPAPKEPVEELPATPPPSPPPPVERPVASTTSVPAPKMPPAGLSKSQQIRWHRENSQTLS
jgi:hypothetical protein